MVVPWGSRWAVDCDAGQRGDWRRGARPGPCAGAARRRRGPGRTRARTSGVVGRSRAGSLQRQAARPRLAPSLAALLDVVPDELLGVLLEDLVDLVEQVVELLLDLLALALGASPRRSPPPGPSAPASASALALPCRPYFLCGQPGHQLGRRCASVQQFIDVGRCTSERLHHRNPPEGSAPRSKTMESQLAATIDRPSAQAAAPEVGPGGGRRLGDGLDDVVLGDQPLDHPGLTGFSNSDCSGRTSWYCRSIAASLGSSHSRPWRSRIGVEQVVLGHPVELAGERHRIGLEGGQHRLPAPQHVGHLTSSPHSSPARRRTCGPGRGTPTASPGRSSLARRPARGSPGRTGRRTPADRPGPARPGTGPRRRTVVLDHGQHDRGASRP